MHKGKMHLVYATDQGYLMPTAVSVASAYRWASNSELLETHILDCGISDKKWGEWIEEMREVLPQDAKIMRHIITAEQLDCLPSYRGGTATWARIYIARLLPEVDWCCYADGDTLFVSDPLKLRCVYDSQYAYMGHRDQHPGNDEDIKRNWHESHGYKWDKEQYCCAGFLLMNLDWFRKNEAEKRLLEFGNRHKDVRWPDQDALYAICFGHIGFLPDEWGIMDNHLYLCKDVMPACIHYVDKKPWRLAPLRRGWYPFTSIAYLIIASKLLRISISQIAELPINRFWLARAIIGAQIFEIMMQIVGLRKKYRQKYAYYMKWVLPYQVKKVLLKF